MDRMHRKGGPWLFDEHKVCGLCDLQYLLDETEAAHKASNRHIAQLMDTGKERLIEPKSWVAYYHNNKKVGESSGRERSPDSIYSRRTRQESGWERQGQGRFVSNSLKGWVGGGGGNWKGNSREYHSGGGREPGSEFKVPWLPPKRSSYHEQREDRPRHSPPPRDGGDKNDRWRRCSSRIPERPTGSQWRGGDRDYGGGGYDRFARCSSVSPGSAPWNHDRFFKERQRDGGRDYGGGGGYNRFARCSSVSPSSLPWRHDKFKERRYDEDGGGGHPGHFRSAREERWQPPPSRFERATSVMPTRRSPEFSRRSRSPEQRFRRDFRASSVMPARRRSPSYEDRRPVCRRRHSRSRSPPASPPPATARQHTACMHAVKDALVTLKKTIKRMEDKNYGGGAPAAAERPAAHANMKGLRPQPCRAAAAAAKVKLSGKKAQKKPVVSVSDTSDSETEEGEFDGGDSDCDCKPYEVCEHMGDNRAATKFQSASSTSSRKAVLLKSTGCGPGSPVSRF